MVLLLTVFLRIYLHQHKDPQRAQKLGAASWTTIVVIALLSDLAVATWEGRANCAEDKALPVITVLSSSIAIVNGTHGMRFWHKAGTAALLTVDALICSRSCSESPGYAIIVALVLSSLLVGHAVSHSLEYTRRCSYLASHLLHEQQRLLHEQQRLLHEQQKTNHAISCERSGFDIALLSADNGRLRRDNMRLGTRRGIPGPARRADQKSQRPPRPQAKLAPRACLRRRSSGRASRAARRSTVSPTRFLVPRQQSPHSR